MMEANDARRTVLQILDLARWAPSGDNEQCWRFEIVADDHVVVHGYDTRRSCVYDLDGTASQIGLGALIETMAVAASRFGLRVEASRREASSPERPLLDVRLIAAPDIEVDRLAAHIETRSVFRRALSTRPLTTVEKDALAASLGDGHRLVWFEGAAARRRMAGLLFASAKIRMITPEAYAVHRDAIAWASRFSVDRVPEAAVGMDPITGRLMRWVMQSWPRVQFFNRFLAGTWMPRLQLDVVPALRCAAHFVLVADKRPDAIDDFIAAGRAVQRLWLTAAYLGLQLQPEVTPLIFARYSRSGFRFSGLRAALELAPLVADRLDRILGRADATNAVFLGRLGAGGAASSRSLRLPLDRLMFDPASDPAEKKPRPATGSAEGARAPEHAIPGHPA